MRNLSHKLRIYLIFIWSVTLVLILFFMHNNYILVNTTSLFNVIFFGIMVALTESITVPFRDISFSTSFAVLLASYVLFGPLKTILILILGFSFRVIKVGNKYKHILNTPIYGTVFNYCALCLPVILANYFYINIGGNFNSKQIVSNIGPIIIFSLVYFVLNTLIIAILYSIQANKKVLYFFISNIRLSILNILLMVPFGIMLVMLFDKFSYFGVIIVLFPIGLARYTFSLYIDSKNQYKQTVNAIMNTIEARDKYTEGHSQRVAELSVKIAKELKYSQSRIEQINIAAMLHDVGKIGIQDNILNKPGKLTEEEYSIIKSHPEIGCHIISNIENLSYAQSIVRSHHERYDGKGYPDGKRQDELELDVFIVQLADSVDAMSTDRPYRKALSDKEITEEIKNNKGTQFHPKVVDAYFKIMEKTKLKNEVI